ncbi:indolepyruvate ferredoxin oxidoreductase subunit alpha [bacterium]|nr:indolepyruvate ferredoxin oxidoreductase subunit alpha [bacterium]
MSEKVLLSGNEAVARGAYEAGIKVATAYPGTPSTEILENVVKYKDDIYCEWAPNEKVAVEVGVGASYGGARTITTMKHVGVNVAADPLFSFAYTGVNGGFILVSADDPGMHSSQNEQDNRRYAEFMKIALLEPSDSQEAKEMVAIGMDMSERFNTPVLLRMSTRLCHSLGLVDLKDRVEVPVKDYKPDFKQRVVIPAHARVLHVALEKRLAELKKYAETTPINFVVEGDYKFDGKKIGIISSGISYQYAREAFPTARFLKMGMCYPFPIELCRDFASEVDELWVIEENEPFIEEKLKAAGITSIGKERIPITNELSQRIVRESMINQKQPDRIDVSNLPPRPPVLCPGCPHRGIFYVAHKLKFTGTTDIGCYTLGMMPPLEMGETCICMGASIGIAQGLEKSRGKEFGKNTLAFIGDSTFIHSGMTGLAEIVYNKSNITVVILDNSITAMTGHQQHPGTGITLMGEESPKLNYRKLAEAIGIEHIFDTDAFDIENITEILKKVKTLDGPKVIINRGRCILLDIKRMKIVPFKVDPDKCIACGQCFKLGCPAINTGEVNEKGKKRAEINPLFCVGEACGLCYQVCPTGAIELSD